MFLADTISPLTPEAKALSIASARPTAAAVVPSRELAVSLLSLRMLARPLVGKYDMFVPPWVPTVTGDRQASPNAIAWPASDAFLGMKHCWPVLYIGLSRESLSLSSVYDGSEVIGKFCLLRVCALDSFVGSVAGAHCPAFLESFG